VIGTTVRFRRHQEVAVDDGSEVLHVIARPKVQAAIARLGGAPAVVAPVAAPVLAPEAAPTVVPAAAPAREPAPVESVLQQALD